MSTRLLKKLFCRLPGIVPQSKTLHVAWVAWLTSLCNAACKSQIAPLTDLKSTALMFGGKLKKKKQNCVIVQILMGLI